MRQVRKLVCGVQLFFVFGSAVSTSPAFPAGTPLVVAELVRFKLAHRTKTSAGAIVPFNLQHIPLFWLPSNRSAITATPVGTFTTSRTPLIAFAAVASNAANGFRQKRANALLLQ